MIDFEEFTISLFKIFLLLDVILIGILFYNYYNNWKFKSEVIQYLGRIESLLEGRKK